MIREVTPGLDGLLSDGTITTIAGDGYLAGASSYPGNTVWDIGDGGPATSARLHGPRAVAVNEQGNAFIADSLNGVLRELGGLVVTVRNVAGTTTSVASTPAEPVFGQPVTLTAIVATADPGMSYPGMVYPSGTVTFYDGSTDVGSADLAMDGGLFTAALTIPALAVGGHAITAAYSGDANFTGSGSGGALTVSETPLPPGSAPWGIVTDPDGALWFTENGLSEIGRYNPANSQLTSYPTPTPASQPVGITVGPDNAIWFAEHVTDQIGRLDPATGQITEYGGLPSGSATQQIASGPLNSVWFTEQTTNLVGRIDVSTGQITQYPIPTPDSQPSGIIEGPDGAVWFGEYEAGQIGRLDPTTGLITEYPIPTPYSGPVQITTGPDGGIWFTESGSNQIGRIDPTTHQFAEYAGAGVGPWGIVTGTDGALWFSETSAARVGRIDPSTGQITQFAGQSSFSALGIAVGPDGNVWFVENAGSLLGHVAPYLGVTVLPDPTSTSVAATAATAVFGQSVTFTATVLPGAPGRLSMGTATFYDRSTVLGSAPVVTSGGVTSATFTTASLADGVHSVSAVYSGDLDFIGSASPVFSTVVAGDGTPGYSGDGGLATAAALSGPTGVAFDAAGDLFIADSNNNVIRELKTDGTIVTVAGNGTAGYSGDGGPATAAALDLGLWYAEIANGGLAVDSAGDLFIADTLNNVVREVRPDGIITTVAGNGTPGYSGDGGPATAATLNNPASLAVDANGDVFIADTNNNVIREVNPDGTIITVAGDGTPGYGGDGGAATAAALRYPTSVVVDTQGDLFIGDFNNGAVREVAADGVISTYNGGVDPAYLALDAHGNLFISDNGFDQVFEQAPDGTFSLVTNAAAPGGVAVDGAGDLVIADDGTNQLREWSGGLLLYVQALSATSLAASLSSSQQGGTGGSVTLQTTSNSSVTAAVEAISGVTNTDPANPETVTLDLGGATTALSAPINTSNGVQVELTSSSGNATVQGATVSGGTVVIDASVAPVDWTVNGGNVTVLGSAGAGDFIVNGGTVTLADGTVITGNSPAIIVNGGTVILQGATARTATNSPTIVVNSGSLVVRNSTIQESTGYTQAAILINGGTVDLGTAASPGGNTFNLNGGGELVHDATSSSVADAGNTLEVNGTPLSATDLSFTTLGSSTPSSVYGQPVTFIAAVRSANPAEGSPTGTVEFLDTTTGSVLGTVPIASGVAMLTSSSIAVGSHAIIALYEGNGNFAFSLAAVTQIVQKDGTTTALSASTSSPNFGQALTFTAKVTASAPGSGTPTGIADFFDTTTNTDLTPGNVAMVLGTATFSTASLPVGTNTIRVSYGGDANFLTSAGTLTVTINQSIIVLDSSAGGALTVSGNASIKVAGSVYVDSSSSSALTASGNAQIKASVIDVHGGVHKSGNASFNPTPTAGAAVLADPLASLPIPTTPGLHNYGSESLSGNSSATIKPGIYSQISVSGNATLTLDSGMYIIEGGGFTVSGNASIAGTGVTIVNAGSKYPNTGGTYGGITVSGNGSYNLSPPTTGSYAGILIDQPRDNTKVLTLSGNAAGMTGTIYAPTAGLSESGNAQLNAALIVDTLTISGNSIANTLGLDAPAGTVAYSPAQIRTGYGFNNLSWDGTGQTIAIVDAYDDPSIYQAVDAFDSQFGLTASGPTFDAQYGPASSFLTVLNQYGQATSLPGADPNGPGTNNWEVEEALDVEWAHAIAPSAQIILVEANSQSLPDLMAGVATAAMQPGVSVVSMSWGFAEGQSVLASDEAAYDHVFNSGCDIRREHGRLRGCGPGVPRLFTERGGCGRHETYAEPGWVLQQRDGLGLLVRLHGWLHRLRRRHQPVRAGAGVSARRPVDGQRTTPDVSLVADPATGAWIADPYNLDPSNPFEVVGGTSLSAPAWAGLLALVNPGRAARGSRA